MTTAFSYQVHDMLLIGAEYLYSAALVEKNHYGAFFGCVPLIIM